MEGAVEPVVLARVWGGQGQLECQCSEHVLGLCVSFAL